MILLKPYLSYRVNSVSFYANQQFLWYEIIQQLKKTKGAAIFSWLETKLLSEKGIATLSIYIFRLIRRRKCQNPVVTIYYKIFNFVYFRGYKRDLKFLFFFFLRKKQLVNSMSKFLFSRAFGEFLFYLNIFSLFWETEQVVLKSLQWCSLMFVSDTTSPGGCSQKNCGGGGLQPVAQNDHPI